MWPFFLPESSFVSGEVYAYTYALRNLFIFDKWVSSRCQHPNPIRLMGPERYLEMIYIFACFRVAQRLDFEHNSFKSFSSLY